MGPLALDHLLIVGDQGVELLGQGLQLGRIAARDPLGAALAHLHHLPAEVEERLQPHPHLQDHRDDQEGAGEHQERRGADGEVAHVAVHRGAVLGGEEDHRRRPFRQAAGQGDDPQRLALRSLAVVLHGGADGQARQVRRARQLGVPQRTREGQREGVQPSAGDLRQLPVLARIDPGGAGVAELGRDDLALVDGRARVEAVGDVLQPRVEAAHRGGVEDEGEGRQGDGQDDDAPHRRQPGQPPNQRGPPQPAPPPDPQGLHASAVSPCSGLRR